MGEEHLALDISQLLYDKKAEDITALRVAHLTVLCDYIVIATARSTIQAKALADHLEEKLLEQGRTPRRVEGKDQGTWIVLDYLSVIVHIFKPEERAHYRLERLWSDGTNKLALPFEALKEA
ncbi:MAG TPA: ribosome silencing factor [Candidatus Limnocylindria bacterium]|nr:ribosome silencing factor [Candidatus Limnocylindria bacterium]